MQRHERQIQIGLWKEKEKEGLQLGREKEQPMQEENTGRHKSKGHLPGGLR